MAGVVIVPRGGTSTRFDDDRRAVGAAGRPEKWDRRLVLDAIFYLVRGGIAWRALPADFPPHQTVYALFRRWTRARAWCRIYAALRERARLADGRGPVPTAAVIDSQTVRAADTVPTARLRQPAALHALTNVPDQYT
jgi:transposase